MYDSPVTHRGHVLLISFHFPPVQGSTGASRSWEFAKWLSEHDWRANVLTVQSRAYPEITNQSSDQPRLEGEVIRAFALDAKRHLAVFGRYLRLTAIPDRWSTWIIGGVLSGIRQIRKDRPDVIYTTYPIVSSHIIGLALHKIFCIPWVAEFRDPMVEETFPPPGIERKLRLWLEKKVFSSASKIILVTPSARAYYDERSGREPEFAVEIPNGINESLVQSAQESEAADAGVRTGKLTLLHSGLLYDEVRDPRGLFLAIRDLKARGMLNSADVEFVFRGSGDEADFSRQVSELGIEDLVRFRESIPYEQAFQEMRTADALMVLQGQQCNRQIPAKLYEYCAMKNPILCLADPDGDTGRLFESLGLGRSVSLEDDVAIGIHLPRFIGELKKGQGKVLNTTEIASLSRRARTRELAAVLNAVRKQDHVN